MTKTRVSAALVMAPLAIAAVLLLPTPWLVALVAIVFLGGLWEWFRLAEIEDATARWALLLANVLLMAALAWGSATGGSSTLPLFKLVSMLGVVWWLLAMLWLRRPRFASNHDAHAHARVFKLAAATLAVIPAWCALAVIHAGQPYGHRWLLVALLIVWAADSGAYFAGRRFGRRKLSPSISPNKTVEGLAGGVLAGVAIAVLAAPLAGAALGQLPLVGLVALFTVLFSVVGDLFESLLKRHVQVKDSGNLIPGHGGLLDRIDSVLAALPVFAMGQYWLGF